MFAEAVHSTVDTGNEALLLLGMQRAERPGDARHQFGHGKEIHFWSFVVAILLFGLGAGVSIAKGIDKLEAQQPLQHAGWAYLVLAVALLFQLGSWIVAWRQLGTAGAGRPLLTALRQAKDPALFPLIFADTGAIAGLLVALARHLLRRPAGLALGGRGRGAGDRRHPGAGGGPAAGRDPRPPDRRGGGAAPHRGHHRRGGAGRLRPRGERGAHHAARARRTSW